MACQTSTVVQHAGRGSSATPRPWNGTTLITRQFSTSKLRRDPGTTKPSHPGSTTSTSAGTAALPPCRLPLSCFSSSSDVLDGRDSVPSPCLTPEAVVKLRNFLLRSPSAVAKLRIVDIVGHTDDVGVFHEPHVKRGKIHTSLPDKGVKRLSQPGRDTVSCNMIGCFPFERCEVVATVVKKKVLYNRVAVTDAKGKGKEKEGQEERYREVASVVFYDLDDESGASMSCVVKPLKVYGRLLKQQPLSRQSSTSSCSSVEFTPVLGESLEAGACPSDPRLWIYRYEKPPEPGKVTSAGPAQPEIPIYDEGTVLRIIGKIVVKPKNGEIELDAIRIEPILPKEDRYPEWHHAQRCQMLLRELYDKRETVRELLQLDEESQKDPSIQMSDHPAQSSSISALDISENRSFANSSIRNRRSLADITDASASISISFGMSSDSLVLEPDSSRLLKKRKKLPSLKTLAEQKVEITKERFLLYAHAHFRSASGSSTRKPSLLLVEREETIKRMTMSHLKADKSLDWLATKCARLEARKAAELKEQESIATPRAKSARGTSASSSIIIPSSSPAHLRSPVARTGSSGKQTAGVGKKENMYLSKDWIEKRKGWLFNWAVKKLREDGVIAIHLPDGDSAISATPKASLGPMGSKCICTAGSAKDVNTLLLARSSGCSTTLPLPFEEESYSLITPQALLRSIERIIKQFHTRNTVNLTSNVSSTEIWSALRRDDMWRYVSKEVVVEAMEML